MLATVEADGRIDDVRLGQALTTDGCLARDFAVSAIQAISHWVAQPIIVDGKPVASHIRLPVTYSLSRSTGLRPPADPSLSHAGLRLSKDSPTTPLPQQGALSDDDLVALDSPVSPLNTPPGG